MESNEQTELISKIETDSKDRVTALGGEVRAGGIGQKGNRTHGHGQQCGDCGGVGIKGLHGNGKNTRKKKNK